MHGNVGERAEDKDTKKTYQPTVRKTQQATITNEPIAAAVGEAIPVTYAPPTVAGKTNETAAEK